MFFDDPSADVRFHVGTSNLQEKNTLQDFTLSYKIMQSGERLKYI